MKSKKESKFYFISNIKSHSLPFLLFIGIIVIFFHNTFLKGKIPFPGDMLLSYYAPWNNTSYFGYNPGSIPSKGQYFDVVRELYPWKTLVIQELKAGKLPLWNPYNFAGTPLLANYQSQTFYPFNFLYFLFSQPIAWTIFLILQSFLGCIFLFLYAREIRLSKSASVLSAILFNFSGFSIIWFEFNTVWHTIIWLPLILYLYERYRNTYFMNPVYIVGVASALFFSATAGHPQDFIYILLFLVVYIFVRHTFGKPTDTNKGLHVYVRAFLPILFGLMIAGIQLIPTFEFFTHSARVPHDVNFVLQSMLFKWWQFPMIIYQDFFGNPATKTYMLNDSYITKAISIGVIGFILVLLSSFKKHSSLWHKKFYQIFSIFLCIIVFASPLTALLYAYPIPFLSTGTPTRVLFLLALSLSLLAGFGFDGIKKMNRQALMNNIIYVVGILLLLWIFTFGYLAKNSNIDSINLGLFKKNMLYITLLSGSVFTLAYISKFKSKALYAIIVLAVLETYVSFIKFNPFVPINYLYPSNEVFTYLQKTAGIDRFWGYGTARIEANFATQFGVFSPDGTDPLNLKWYNALLQSSKEGKLSQKFTRSTRSDAQIYPGYGADDLPNNPYRFRIMDLLGIKYVLSRSDNPQNDSTFPKPRFSMLWQNLDGWIVYENTMASPRFFLTDAIRYFRNDKDFEQQLFGPDFDPKRMILLEDSLKEKIRVAPTVNKSVVLISYAPTTVQIRTESDQNQLLYLSDAFDPNWRVYIDGEKSEIYKANYTFRAVPIPSGKRTVIFNYEPKFLLVGYFSAGLGVGLDFMLLIYYLIYHRKHHTEYYTNSEDKR